MKRLQVLNPLFLLLLCTSCVPAGDQTANNSWLCYGTVGIVIILGVITLGLTIFRKRSQSTSPKDSTTSKPTSPKSGIETSTFNADKSTGQGKENTHFISDDLDSKVEAVKRNVQQTIEDNKPAQTNSSAGFSKPDQVVNIQIEPDETKAQAATEVVDVPNGVIIKVKRIRTVEHTVNIEWAAALSGKGEVGIKQIVSVSIQGEIQRIKGYVSQQTESVEYEVTLNGEKHNQYKLVWMDIWLKGTATIQDNNNSYIQPFQFRDRTELKVVPFTDS
jgi:hypothetical protein